jgi:hypothetical protein
MIVIVVKKLRGFVEGQFWWGCHQSACAKKFWHHPTVRGISVAILHQSSVEALLAIPSQEFPFNGTLTGV